MDNTLPHKANWQQFISPGAHLQYGIPLKPLTVSLGMQNTPRDQAI